MAQDRKLTLSFKADLKEGQKFQKFLSDLAAQGNKVAKSLSGVTLGAGPGVQKGALAKSLLEQKNLFRDMGKEAENVGRIFKNVVGRSSDELANKLTKTSQKIKTLTMEHARLEQHYAEMQQSGASAKTLQAIQRKIGGAEGRLLTNVAQQGQMQQQLEALQGGVAGGGMGARLLAGAKIGGRVLGLAGIAVAGAGVIAQELRDQKMDFLRRESGAAGAFNDIVINSRQGDMTHVNALAQIMNDPSKRKDMIALMQRSGVMRGLETGGEAVGNFMQGNFGAIAPQSIIRAFGDTDVKLREEFRTQLNQQATVNAVDQFDVDQFRARAGSRVETMRMMGGEGRMNAWFKAGGNMGFGEDRVAGMFSGVMQQAGRKAASAAMPMVMRGIAAGLAEGAATQMAAGGAMGMGGDPLMAALQLQGNGMDVIAAQMLGGNVASYLTSGNAITSGMGFMAGMAGGSMTGTAQDVLTMNQKMMGSQLYGQLQGGGLDPYQNSMSWVNVIGALGTNSSPYAQAALKRAISNPITAEDIMKGELPPELQGMGISLDQARSAIQANNRTSILRYMQNAGDTANGPAFQMMQNVVDQYGGDMGAFLQSEIYPIRDKKEQERKLRMFSGLGATIFNQEHGAFLGMARGMMTPEDATMKNKLAGDAAFGSTALMVEKTRFADEERARAKFPGARKDAQGRDMGFTMEERDLRAGLENIKTFVGAFENGKNLSTNMQEMSKAVEGVTKSLNSLKTSLPKGR
jgi:hypothetical protein